MEEFEEFDKIMEESKEFDKITEGFDKATKFARKSRQHFRRTIQWKSF